MEPGDLILPAPALSSVRFLDHLREALHAWSVRLYDAPSSGFRQNAEVGVNILSSTDVVWIRYAGVGSAEPGAPDREGVLRYLQHAQDPDTGKVRHDPGLAGQGHGDGHAFWQTVRALNILGGQLRFFPRHYGELRTPAQIEAWFDRWDWESPRGGGHHEVLGLIPLLVSLDSREWRACLFRKIAGQQSPASGCWPKSKPSISRTFAYTALHFASGMLPPFSERIVDAVLRLQRPSGLWGAGAEPMRLGPSRYPSPRTEPGDAAEPELARPTADRTASSCTQGGAPQRQRAPFCSSGVRYRYATTKSRLNGNRTLPSLLCG